MIFQRQIMRLARFIDRHTPWLNGVKNRLDIAHKMFALVSSSMSDKKKQELVKSFRTDIVARKIKELEDRGVAAPKIYILCVESIGDVIACEPISRYVRGLSPKADITWVVRKGFEELVEYNPAIDHVAPVGCLGEGEDFCSEKALLPDTVIVNCHMDGWRCMRSNRSFPNPNNPAMNLDNYLHVTGILGAYSVAAGLPMLDDQPRFHLKPGLRIPHPAQNHPYVVFHCHSTDTSKNWTIENWNRLAEDVVSKGWHVVEIGTLKIVSSDSINYHDMSGNRSFQEIALIVRGASIYVGIDSGFAHMANCFEIPSVMLQGHYRNYDIYNPYSGYFPRSGKMRFVRAPSGKRAEAIPYESVCRPLLSLTGLL